MHGHVTVDGVRLHHVTAGSGPDVVLLHGFPETWFTWRHQVPHLAARHRVTAFDLPGYGGSGPLPARSGYRAPAVAELLRRALAELGRDRPVLVGHDWGGLVAWCLALAHPGAVRALAVLGCPHPSQVDQISLANPRQLARSAYMFGFRLPVVPELVLRWAGPLAARGIVRDRAARLAWRQELSRGDPRAMLDYYRNLPALRGRAWPSLRVPALLVWSRRDAFLGAELAAASQRVEPGLSVAYLPGAGHWVHHQDPAAVHPVLDGFLDAVRTGARHTRDPAG